MSAPAAIPVPSLTPRARVEAQLVLLDRLTALGMGFAEAAGRRGQAAFDDPEQAEAEFQAGLDFEKAARSVRLSIALQARLMQDLPEIEKAERVGAVFRASDARAGIRRQVERAVRADGHDAGAAGALAGRVRDRLEQDYEGAELLARPAAEIVARLCRELGLSPEATAEALAPFRGAEDDGAEDYGAAGGEPDPPAAAAPNANAGAHAGQPPRLDLRLSG